MDLRNMSQKRTINQLLLFSSTAQIKDMVILTQIESSKKVPILKKHNSDKRDHDVTAVLNLFDKGFYTAL